MQIKKFSLRNRLSEFLSSTIYTLYRSELSHNLFRPCLHVNKTIWLFRLSVDKQTALPLHSPHSLLLSFGRSSDIPCDSYEFSKFSINHHSLKTERIAVRFRFWVDLVKLNLLGFFFRKFAHISSV